MTRLLLLPSSMLMPRILEWSNHVQYSHNWLTSMSSVETSNTILAMEFALMSLKMTNSMHSWAVGLTLHCIFGWWWISTISPSGSPDCLFTLGTILHACQPKWEGCMCYSRRLQWCHQPQTLCKYIWPMIQAIASLEPHMVCNFCLVTFICFFFY